MKHRKLTVNDCKNCHYVYVDTEYFIFPTKCKYYKLEGEEELQRKNPNHNCPVFLGRGIVIKPSAPSELKPCPFCGGKAKQYSNFDFVMCESCGTRGMTYDGNSDNVTKNWNSRPIEDELRDEIAKLHKQYRGAISYLQDKVDDLCKEREKLRSEIEQLKCTFREQEAEIDKQMKGRRVTEAELMAAKAQIEQDVAEVEELQKENGELMTALEAANAKIERVKQWADTVPLAIAKAEVLAALGEVKK